MVRRGRAGSRALGIEERGSCQFSKAGVLSRGLLARSGDVLVFAARQGVEATEATKHSRMPFPKRALCSPKCQLI